MLKEFDKLAASRISFTKVTFAKVNLDDDLELGKRWNVEPPNGILPCFLVTWKRRAQTLFFPCLLSTDYHIVS
jgi:hypothetical protein